MVTNLDGGVASVDENDLLCGCAKKGIQFSEEWNEKVAKDSGHHYRLPGDDCLYLDFDGHCQVSCRAKVNIQSTEVWKQPIHPPFF